MEKNLINYRSGWPLVLVGQISSKSEADGSPRFVRVVQYVKRTFIIFFSG